MEPASVRSDPWAALAMPKSATRTRPSADEEDVGRLHVAVDEPGGVGGAERVGDLGADGEHGVQLEGTVFVEVGPEGGARHELHHDGVDAVLGHRVVDRHDRRVGEAGGGDGFASESADERLVSGEVGVQDLGRDPTVEELIAGVPHGGHAAGRDGAVQSVAAGERPARQVVGTAAGDLVGWAHSVPDATRRGGWFPGR